MAQLFHDRKQREARSDMSPAERAATPYIDYLRPLVADADTGHGGLTAVMKLTKLFVEKGAAGIHIEDQAPGKFIMLESFFELSLTLIPFF